MILQALVKYYEDLEKQGKISKRGWCTGKVSYGIQLSYDGKVQAVLSLKREQQTGKKTILSPQPLTVPEMDRKKNGFFVSPKARSTAAQKLYRSEAGTPMK